MHYSRTLPAFAIASTLCVLLLFLFPASAGSFQAVCGPTTALRAKRSVEMIFLAIILCSLVLDRLAGLLAMVVSYCPAQQTERDITGSPLQPAVLRC